MRREIDIQPRVYIESYGTIASRADVRQFDPKMDNLLDAWYAYHKVDDPANLLEVHHSGGAQHDPETLELCDRIAISGQETDLTLVYVHRGHHRQCKTPLLQMLLATLSPDLRVHGMRVEDELLPLDVVLFAVAVLRERGRCLIIKDNAIRLGTPDTVSASYVRYLLLSRSKGPWAMERITLFDNDEPAFTTGMEPVLLDDFLTQDQGGEPTLSLASRTTNNRLGIINIGKV